MKTILHSLWLSAHRRQLIVSACILCGCGIIAVGAMLWSYSSRSAALLERDAEQAAWALSSTAAGDLQEVESTLPQHEASALRLLQGGFTTAADRVGWTESVVAALNSLHPAGYTIEVSTAQLLPLPDDMVTSYTERGLPLPTFEVNDLSLKVQGLTEDELTHLLELAIERGGGIVRAEHCRLQLRIDQQGIDADCNLRRYRIRAGAVEPTS